MNKFNPKEFEQKWVEKWEKDKIYKTPQISNSKKKKYILDMFPYPSGTGLHVGHVEGYTATDIYSRFCRMRGEEVLHPMGFDSFGLPAENYAIKTGKHPKITTDEAIEMFIKQMKASGFSYDWDVVLAAHWPEYYRWTQWLFLLMYKRGLAYRKKQAVNWCPSCQTVLANEQVVNGRCERCDSEVIQREMEQWFLKITDYADRLLSDLDKLDWPESTKTGQRNWIGKSEGINITYGIKGQKDKSITIFTTRPDTNFGATFIVAAPDSSFVQANMNSFPESEKVAEYVGASLAKKELERVSSDKAKTGIFTGWYAVNQLNGRELPIYVGDFVLGTVGTGCLVGVPGHDRRDFEFARAMNLPILRVVVDSSGEKGDITQIDQVQEEAGVMMNSGFLDDMDIHTATAKIMDYLEEKCWGKRVVNYRLRDWLISRQRFWGAPIPMRKSLSPESQNETNGEKRYEYTPVDESELPVVLPMDVEFKPTGKSPLTEHPNFVGREVDTMDTFVDSSWYFLRFAQLTANRSEDPFNDTEIKKIMNDWLPVDLYVGGAEHTVLHLLYARFFTKVLYDAGYVNFDEPFLKLRHQGTILGPDHRKMSKRWGNVINPLDVISEYGADTLRMYEMFMGPLAENKAWSVQGVQGIHRFLNRVWNQYAKVKDLDFVPEKKVEDALLEQALHKLTKKLTEDTENLKFNTAIAEFMKFMNLWEENINLTTQEIAMNFIILLAPYAPFITEEIWSIHIASSSVHAQVWPSYDEGMLVEAYVDVPVQVNGKLRGVLRVSQVESKDQAYLLSEAKKDENISKFLTEEPRKTIFVPGKVLNFVV